MKKILILLLLCPMALPVLAQKREKPKSEAYIEFKTTEHDFGRIWEKGNKVTHDFIFTNTGVTPLMITRIATTCKCIDHKFSKKPIHPGETETITISYSPKKQKGVFYKVIQVYSNAPEERHILTVRGEVFE